LEILPFQEYKSGIRRKHEENIVETTEDHVLHHTSKKRPKCQSKPTYKNISYRAEDPSASASGKGGDQRRNRGVGRTCPATHPGAFLREIRSYPPNVGCKRFHMGRWRVPTSRAIKGALPFSLNKQHLKPLSLTLL